MTDVVITGIGYIGPNGADWTAAWQAAFSGVSAFEAWPTDRQSAPGGRVGIVHEMPADRFLPARTRAASDRTVVLGTTAAGLAFEDSGLPTDGPYDDVASFMATCYGEFGSVQRFGAPRFQGRPEMLNPARFPPMCRNLFCGQIAITFRLRGPSSMFAGSALSAFHAVARGVHAIRLGRVRRALVGGVESLTKFSLHMMHMLYGSHSFYNPPCFFADETGMIVPAEGSCMVVLEDASAAERRGARPYARIDVVEIGRAGTRGGAAALVETTSRLIAQRGEIGLVSTGQTGAGLTSDREERAFLEHLSRRPDGGPPLAAIRSHMGQAESASAVAQLALAVTCLLKNEVPPVEPHARDISQSLRIADGQMRPNRPRALVSALDGAGNYGLIALSRV